MFVVEITLYKQKFRQAVDIPLTTLVDYASIRHKSIVINRVSLPRMILYWNVTVILGLTALVRQVFQYFY